MIYLYGAGGHAKVIADILELNGIAIGGFFDDDASKKIWNYAGFSFPGPFDLQVDELIISIGNNTTRKKITKKMMSKYYTAIHPSAIVLHKHVLSMLHSYSSMPGEGTSPAHLLLNR